MLDATYDIIEELVTLSHDGNGWSKELNVVSWNYAPQKFDLRYWAPDHTQPGNGVTLTPAEAREVLEALAPRLGYSLVKDDVETAKVEQISQLLPEPLLSAHELPQNIAAHIKKECDSFASEMREKIDGADLGDCFGPTVRSYKQSDIDRLEEEYRNTVSSIDECANKIAAYCETSDSFDISLSRIKELIDNIVSAEFEWISKRIEIADIAEAAFAIEAQAPHDKSESTDECISVMKRYFINRAQDIQNVLGVLSAFKFAS